MLTNAALCKAFNKGKLLSDYIGNENEICLIGTASKGPSMSLVYAKDATDYKKVLQIFGEDSQLANAFLEATSKGAKNIYMIRVNGMHREIKIGEYLKLYSLEANELYNEISVELVRSNGQLSLNINWSLLGLSKSYYLEGLTFSQLASKINQDAIIGLTYEINSSNKVTYEQVPFVAEAISNKLILETINYQTSIENVSLANIADYNEDLRVNEILDFFQSYPLKNMVFLNSSFDDISNHYYEIENVQSYSPGYISIDFLDPVNLEVGDILNSENTSFEIKYIKDNFAVLTVGEITSKYLTKPDLIYNKISKFCTEKSLMLEPCIVTIGQLNSLTREDLMLRVKSFLQDSTYIDFNTLEYSKKINLSVSEYVVIPLMNNRIVNTHSEYVSNGTATVAAMIQNIEEYENISSSRLDDYLITDNYALDKIQATQLNKLGFITGYMFNSSYYLCQGYNLLKYSREYGEGRVIYQKLSPVLVDVSNIRLLQDFLFNIRVIYDLIGENGDQSSKIKSIINLSAEALYPYIQDHEVVVNSEAVNGGYSTNIMITLYILGTMQSLNMKVGVS